MTVLCVCVSSSTLVVLLVWSLLRILPLRDIFSSTLYPYVQPVDFAQHGALTLRSDTHPEKALRISVGMPAYNFDPLTAATATLHRGANHPFIFAFAAPAETSTVSGASATTFPLGVAVSRGAVLLADLSDDSDSDSDSDSDDDCDQDSSKTPPGHGGTPPGQEKKACRTGSTTAAPTTSSSTTTPSPSQSSPPTSPPSVQPTLTSPEVDSSQSTEESSSTSDTDDSATSTGASQPPSSSTQSPNPQGTTTGSTTTSSTSYSPSTPLTTSSHSGVPAANLSTPPTPTAPTPTQPSSATATPASGLSAGSAIGIALGVFAAAGIFVAAALFLFLLLRKRKRRHKLRDSAADSTTLKRQLTSSVEDDSDGTSPSRRPLSSTWSWFGSLPIGSEPSDPDPDHDHEYRYEYGTSPHPRSPDDPFQDQDTEKGAIVGDLHPRAPTRAPSPYRDSFAAPAHVEHAPAPALAPQPEPEDSEDTA